MRNFVQSWFRVEMKMMRNFVKKSHFLQNHATVAQANLLFRGHPNSVYSTNDMFSFFPVRNHKFSLDNCVNIDVIHLHRYNSAFTH